MAKKLKTGPKRFVRLLFLVLFIFVGFEVSKYYITLNAERTPVYEKKEVYLGTDFGFLDLRSDYDYNQNGIDDYKDFLNGALEYAYLNPKYVSKYYGGGYPPETEGVCTDLIWFALKEGGYLLKDLMAKDIRNTKKQDTYGIDIIDDNIDFRRVGNQETFLKRYAKSLSTDIYNIMDFQPGDIIVFNHGEHIAMVSNKRNALGIVYLLQNRDETQEEKEEDRLLTTDMKVTGHYRIELNDKLNELLKSL